MTNKVGGIAYIKVDGKQFLLRGNLKYGPADRERETVAGMDQVHGFKEMVKTPFVEMDLTDTAGLNVKKFQEMTDVSVVVELGNGKQFVLSNAWCVTAPEVDASEGQFTVRFEGLRGEEITVNG
jgi:hypothetical protein